MTMTDVTPETEPAPRPRRGERARAERLRTEAEVRAEVRAAGQAFLRSLDKAEEARDFLREVLRYGQDQGISDNRLSQMLTEVIPPGTHRLGRPVPRALMGVRRLTGRAPSR